MFAALKRRRLDLWPIACIGFGLLATLAWCWLLADLAWMGIRWLFA